MQSPTAAAQSASSPAAQSASSPAASSPSSRASSRDASPSMPSQRPARHHREGSSRRFLKTAEQAGPQVSAAAEPSQQDHHLGDTAASEQQVSSVPPKAGSDGPAVMGSSPGRKAGQERTHRSSHEIHAEAQSLTDSAGPAAMSSPALDNAESDSASRLHGPPSAASAEPDSSNHAAAPDLLKAAEAEQLGGDVADKPSMTTSMPPADVQHSTPDSPAGHSGNNQHSSAPAASPHSGAIELEAQPVQHEAAASESVPAPVTDSAATSAATSAASAVFSDAPVASADARPSSAVLQQLKAEVSSDARASQPSGDVASAASTSPAGLAEDGPGRSRSKSPQAKSVRQERDDLAQQLQVPCRTCLRP